MSIGQFKTARARTLKAVDFGALSHKEALPTLIQQLTQAFDTIGVPTGAFQVTGKPFEELFWAGELSPAQVFFLREIGYSIKYEVLYGNLISVGIKLF